MTGNKDKALCTHQPNGKKGLSINSSCVTFPSKLHSYQEINCVFESVMNIKYFAVCCCCCPEEIMEFNTRHSFESIGITPLENLIHNEGIPDRSQFAVILHVSASFIIPHYYISTL